MRSSNRPKTLAKRSKTESSAYIARHKHFQKYTGFYFILPWVIGFFIFQLYPFAASFYYSFTKFNILSKPSFIGLNNYIRLFTFDPDFKQSLFVTFKYALIEVPGKLIFALIIAMLLNKDVRGVNAFRTIYYLPSILGGSVAISALWKLMFMKEGVINELIGILNIPPVDWLGSPRVALYTISLLQVWQFGSAMVLFLAALKQIPVDLYESASLEGAGKIQKFIYITFPMITPILFFNLIMQTINALQNFTSAFIITKGGPLKSTYLIGLKLYTEGFNNFKMGYASAISWIMFGCILCFTLLVFRSSSVWVFYQDGDKF